MAGFSMEVVFKDGATRKELERLLMTLISLLKGLPFHRLMLAKRLLMSLLVSRAKRRRASSIPNSI